MKVRLINSNLVFEAKKEYEVIDSKQFTLTNDGTNAGVGYIDGLTPGESYKIRVAGGVTGKVVQIKQKIGSTYSLLAEASTNDGIIYDIEYSADATRLVVQAKKAEPSETFGVTIEFMG